MLVIVMEEQILSVQKVCQGCLLANRSGLPRWRKGELCCGHSLAKAEKNQPALYECEMGFRIANIQ